MSDERLASAAVAAEAKDWSGAADLLATGPQTDEIVDKRGWYLSRAKRYAEAVEVFTELRKRRPHDYRPPYMIGFQYYQQDHWRESLPWFAEALTHKPDHIKSMWRSAHALEQAGDDKQAALMAGRLLQLWHELPPSRQEEDRKSVAKASFLLGRRQLARDPAGAADLFAQATELEPDDPFMQYRHAQALRRSGRGREALPAAERAHRLKRGDPNITVEYAEALAANGRRAEAVKALAHGARRCSGWKAYQAGKLALQLDDPRLAVDLLRNAERDRTVRSDPGLKGALAEAISRAGASGADRPSHNPRRRRGSGRPASGGEGSAGHGLVAVLRIDRGFGFLVDDAGVRRHFRLDSADDLAQGQEVTFVPVAAAKGPAANNVCPV